MNETVLTLGPSIVAEDVPHVGPRHQRTAGLHPGRAKAAHAAPAVRRGFGRCLPASTSGAGRQRAGGGGRDGHPGHYVERFSWKRRSGGGPILREGGVAKGGRDVRARRRQSRPCAAEVSVDLGAPLSMLAAKPVQSASGLKCARCLRFTRRS